MKRSQHFIDLVFGWRDSESGYGAGRWISPELKSFFDGWNGKESLASDVLSKISTTMSVTERDDLAEKLMVFVASLDEISDEIRQQVREATCR